jgi:hypothetical protein
MSTNIAAVREAEFVDLTGLKSGWGIGRSLCYELLKDGRIRSVNLRREGRVRGKRLIEVQSVRKFLDSSSDNIDPLLSEQLRRVRAIGIEKERIEKERKQKPRTLRNGESV